MLRLSDLEATYNVFLLWFGKKPIHIRSDVIINTYGPIDKH